MAPGTPREAWERFAEVAFDTPGMGQGLPHAAVTSIVQDRQGFLWVGTEEGLARFDGYHFKVYRHADGGPGALPGDHVQSLYVDRQDRLWVGTITNGLALYDAAHDTFTRYSTPEGLSGATVAAILEDERGRLWIATNDGVDRLDPATGQIEHFYQETAGSPLPNPSVHALALDARGRLWIGTNDGLAYRDGDRLTRVTLPGLEYGVSSFASDDEGRLWIGAGHGGVAIVEGAGETKPDGESGGRTADAAVRWLAPPTAAPTPAITSLLPLPGRRMWVASWGGGIEEWQDTHPTRRVRHDPLVPDSLPVDAVGALAHDRAGLIWVGTYGGLHRHDPSAGAVLTLFSAPTRPDHLGDRNIISLSVPTPDRVLVGGLGNGADEIALDTGTIRPLPGRDMATQSVWAWANDAEGTWFATATGLYLHRPDRKPWRLPLLPPQRVTALVPDATGLWVAGHVSGLTHLRRHDAAPHREEGEVGYTLDPAWWGDLTDPRVTALLADGSGGLWVGTQNGINHLDPAHGAVRHIPTRLASQGAASQKPDDGSLPAAPITSMALDGTGRLWVGSQGGGVAVAIGTDFRGMTRFRVLSVADGLPHATVSAILADRRGRMWVSTADGIAVIDPATFAIRVLHPSDGLRLRHYWTGAAAATPDGLLLFGALDGLSVIDPTALRDDMPPPPLVLTDVRVGARALTGPEARSITLAPGERGLAVEFAALDYAAPERIRYAYKLDGYDRDWVAADADHRSATYTGLPPGRYTLRIRASDRDGDWGATGGDAGAPNAGLSVAVRVLPAWHQTWWARLMGLAAGLAAMTGVVAWRTKRLRHQRHRLEQQVAARTRALNQANKELERLAHHDALTGLINRRRLLQVAAAEIDRSRRYNHRLSVLLIDLDHFKKVNDQYGHAAGDHALRVATTCLEGSLRGCDTAARLGGEELVALLPETDFAGAWQLAERFRVTLESCRIAHADRTFSITASIGVAQWSPEEDDIQPTLARADIALYRIKNSGRNAVATEPPWTDDAVAIA